MIANYHTHTRWCRHGTGEIKDYLEEALAHGLSEIAITEHVPLLGDPDPRRLFCDEFPAFDGELNRLIAEYAGRLRVRKGFECEYYPGQMDSYRRFRDDYGYEILILGQHTNKDRSIDSFALTEPWQVSLYADEVCEALRTGLFTFLAHPDVLFCGYRAFDAASEGAMRRIFATCEALDIPVELNANGWHYRRGYPCLQVWQTLAPQYRLRCLVGTDAHHVEDLMHPAAEKMEAVAREAGLCLLEKLP